MCGVVCATAAVQRVLDMPRTVLVSACLLGEKVRYDGGDCACTALWPHQETVQWLPFCPEVAGGLAVPRAPAEIQGGDGAAVLAGSATVMDAKGQDVRGALMRGAVQALALAQQHRVVAAVLKQKSPSCGCGLIYDGTFSGTLKNGHGVTAALLQQHGIDVFSR